MALGYVRGRPDVDWWIEQIHKGIEFRKRAAYENQWPTWRKYYRGEWNPRTLPTNIFFKMLRSTVPRVYFRNPRVSVTSKRPGPDGLARATILERVDNKMLQQMGVKRAMKRIVQDAFLFGTGIGKLGFGAEFTPTPDMLETREPVRDGRYRVEYNSTVQPNMPWFMRVPPGQFIVPPGASSLEDSRWVAHWISRPVDDVKGDPRLSNTSNLGPTSRQSGTFTLTTGTGFEDHIDLVEIRDKKTEKVIVLAPYSSDKVLLFDDDGLQIDGRFPFYAAIFNDDDEWFWGLPDSKILEPQQLELNEIRTQIMKHRRAAIIRLLVQRGGMNEEEAAKLLDEDAPAVLFTEDSPSAIMTQITAAEIPQALLLAEEQVLRDVRETLGFSRNESGEYTPGSRKPTATEVTVVKQAANIRIDERRDVMADMLVQLVNDMNAVIFENWDQETVIDVAGPDGAPVWVRFQPDMLKSGRYEVSVDPDTGLPETRDNRRQLAMQAYEVLKDNPLVRPDGLTRYLLNELGNVAFDDMLAQPQPPAAGPGSFNQPLDLNEFTQLLAERNAA